MTEQDRFLLSDADSERIFRERIVPDQLTGTQQDHPAAVFVAGQPGDGKAGVTGLVQATLAERGRPVVLSATILEAYHPRLHEPITDDRTTADRYVEADGLRWLARAEDHVIQQRCDVVVETEVADPEAFAASAAAFKAAGYHVEVAILAVHEAHSRLGVLQRHLRALEAFGFGRLVTQSRHDAGYAGVLRAAELIDAGDWADRVGVLRPDGQLIYGNERAGAWQQPARTADAITWERERTWTVPESRDFLDATSAVERFGLSAPVQWIRDEGVDGAKALMALAKPRLDPVAVTLHIAKAGTSFSRY
ncbi:zeta toxin family protein [Kribbella sp. NBC_00709]|uniref:zeta toxin family protein n=1 Tax=Kribbella sp. NBC_00709 TaxID=2975972 RepID=UPI002E280EFF|nr:zeta toxin family protein [Kribbella sp. NBC_00709]